MNAAKATMSTDLCLDEDSIFAIDALIERGWPDGLPSDKRSMIIHLWGSFLGEAMRCTLRGDWVEADAGLGVAVGLAIAHPFAKIEKRFDNGMSDSVTHFYKAFKAQTQKH
jgi:hypothetical protein